jgi:uncharacterized repeat protein (TIGR03803 family)
MIALNIVAGLFFLLGAVWFLQGISVLPGVAVAAGIGLFLLANRCEGAVKYAMSVTLSSRGNDADPHCMSLIQRTDGDLYGTSETGRANGSGTRIQVTPTGTLTILYSFCTKN